MADSEDDELTEPGFALYFAGIVILFGTILLALVTFAYFKQGLQFQDARIGVGLGGAIATIGLALGVYLQGGQNEEIIKQNREEIENARKQSIILQESQWLPLGVFNYSRDQIVFTKNPPYQPKVKLILEVQEGICQSSWIEPDLHENTRRDGLREWIVGVGGGTFLDEFSLKHRSYDGTLEIRFDSITGSGYEYQYNVRVFWDGRITFEEVRDVIRKMPWEDDSA